MQTDVLIVGAGPAGLSAAIRLKQLNPGVAVTVIEKGAYIGAHTLSGAVIETRALDELLADDKDNKDDPAPLDTAVTRDVAKYLTPTRSFSLPKPPQMRNHGNYIVSLQELVQWLGRRAEQAGVDIFTGFGGRELMITADGRIAGVILNDVGVAKNGQRSANYEPGMAIRAKATLLAEGCHGSLSKQVIAQYNLRQGRQHQTYGLGIKEVWRVDPGVHQPGLVFHSLGFPLVDASYAYGGGFMYHYGQHLVSVGLVVGLDYTNPFLNPYKEFQRFKRHPEIEKILAGGTCLAYGGRALNEGGLQSIPRLSFPGGLLLGCSAGFVNVPKIKGVHNAMKSGMLAAETIADSPGDCHLGDYDRRIAKSWIATELHQVRNVRPAFKYGFWPGLLMSGLSTILFNGHEPWTLSHPALADHETLTPSKDCKEIEYPKADGKTTFDVLESVSRTGTDHNEDQPSHLQLKQGPAPQLTVNLHKFAGPEQKFCPAGVYEYVKTAHGQDQFVINAQNCIHCKTCDIKDPSQNINWVVPEGGGGPNYQMT